MNAFNVSISGQETIEVTAQKRRSSYLNETKRKSNMPKIEKVKRQKKFSSSPAQ